MTVSTKVTLALLAYNEAATIEATICDAAREMEKSFAPGEWEILIINDDSRDETGKICDGLSTQFASVRTFHHNPNRGYIGATLSSLREARGEFVCIFDGDGQHTAADVARFVAELERGSDLVFGWKKQRFDPLERLILTRGLRLAARYFLRTRLHDINAGCRGFKRQHAAKLSIIKHRINFIGPELYARARLNDLKISEIIVRHAPREGGQSSHAISKIPGEIAQVISYLRALRSELKAEGKFRRFL